MKSIYEKYDGMKVPFSDKCSIEICFLDRWFFRIHSETCELNEIDGIDGGYVVLYTDELDALIRAIELVKTLIESLATRDE